MAKSKIIVNSLFVLTLLLGLSGCARSTKTDPEISSGSNWLACDSDDDCDDHPDAVGCGSSGYCEDARGKPVSFITITESDDASGNSNTVESTSRIEGLADRSRNDSDVSDGGERIDDASSAPGTTNTFGSTPTIPPVRGACPVFRTSIVSFGGLDGISLEVGAKPSGPTAPMVFYWHGTDSAYSEYIASAEAVRQGVLGAGGVLVSFEGTSGEGDGTCSGTFTFYTGDFDIADQLVACAVRDHNVDPRRIYTTGCDAGGLFAACMASKRSNYIAAVATNSGGLVFPVPIETDFTPALMTMHGSVALDVVSISFPVASATADDFFKSRGGFVINCDHGGSHCQASTHLYESVWQFFLTHPYGVDPYPWTSGLPESFPSYCSIY